MQLKTVSEEKGVGGGEGVKAVLRTKERMSFDLSTCLVLQHSPYSVFAMLSTHFRKGHQRSYST